VGDFTATETGLLAVDWAAPRDGPFDLDAEQLARTMASPTELATSTLDPARRRFGHRHMRVSFDPFGRSATGS
jgi:hypothetical protein